MGGEREDREETAVYRKQGTKAWSLRLPARLSLLVTRRITSESWPQPSCLFLNSVTPLAAMESQETGLQEVDSIKVESKDQQESDSRKVESRKVQNKNAGITVTDGLRSQVLDPAAAYNMKNARRGLALIFNHEWFFWKLTLPERKGSSADRDNLQRRLTELGFEVRCYNDLREADVLEKIHDAARSDHSDADCFLCVFLSHGEDDYIYAFDGKIEIKTLTSPFKGDQCQSLAGKPKIFIIQACRGSEHDEPVLVTDTTDGAVPSADVNTVEVDAASVHTLPAGADFIMCYSVAEGYYSHRETLLGSWYIQDFCEALKMHGRELEFTELLTLVNRMVSMRSVGMCLIRSAIGKKQVPCFSSMLTKKLYLRPKN